MSLQLDLYNWQSGKILCFVAKPDTKPVVLEVEVDRNAIGQDVLDKVCEALGTVEKDYFGLQVNSPRKDPFWMNLRNRVVGQISGQPPYRLRLRVKYYVQPHLLLQESTRQIFYYQLRQDIIDGKLTIPPNKLPKLMAYVAQIEHGNFGSLETSNIHGSLKMGERSLSAEDIHSISSAHKVLDGTKPSRCMYLFLKEAGELPSYGTEVFYAKIEVPVHHGLNTTISTETTNTNVMIRVGPFGLEIVEEKSEEVRRLPFTAVQLATHTGKMIDIDTVQDDGTSLTLSFRMSSEKSSNALYRCITEMLAFFTWETVHSSVMHQYSRDFKGHLLALFRPDVADQGKQYVFDVQRTWREAYDLARRTLHKQNMCQNMPSETTPLHDTHTSENISADHTRELQMLHDRLSAIRDALTCRVCMDKEINSVFWPCGHQVCCHECASLCQDCPVCRSNVQKVQVVFPSITRDFVASGQMDTSDHNETVDSCTPIDSAPQTPTHLPSTPNDNPSRTFVEVEAQG